ncbi:MAG TPA: ABC transporter substrate-binding protein [Spongiibacteraceae bacterium]|nr:ABC transporter substrate-binding protein [Spongiibacteraceae bacterium]
MSDTYKRGSMKVLFWLLCLTIFNHASAAEENKLRAVRIANIAMFVDGKSEIGGTLSPVVIQQGWLAQELQKRGIELQWVPVPVAVGGPIFNENLVNGSADFASYGDFPAIIGKAGGVDIKLIVPAGRGANSYLIVRSDSTAKTIADLKGKRVSVQRGRPYELAFNQLLSAQGLQYNDFKIFNTNAQAGAAALAAGSIDALFTTSDAYLLEDKGVGRIIWSTKGTDWTWRAELFARRQFAETYPEITQLVANAYVKAAYWSAQEENRAAVLQFNTRSGVPLSAVERDYAGDAIAWKDRWSPLYDAYMVDHYREAIAFTRAQNLIRKDFPVEDLLDRRFLQEALRELQLTDYWTPRTAESIDAGKKSAGRKSAAR